MQPDAAERAANRWVPSANKMSDVECEIEKVAREELAAIIRREQAEDLREVREALERLASCESLSGAGGKMTEEVKARIDFAREALSLLPEAKE